VTSNLGRSVNTEHPPGAQDHPIVSLDDCAPEGTQTGWSIPGHAAHEASSEGRCDIRVRRAGRRLVRCRCGRPGGSGRTGRLPEHRRRVIGLVALGDPTDPWFEQLVSALRANVLVTRAGPARSCIPDGRADRGCRRGRPADRLLADQGLVPRTTGGCCSTTRRGGIRTRSGVGQILASARPGEALDGSRGRTRAALPPRPRVVASGRSTGCHAPAIIQRCRG
jgi:hypothetical protein